MSRDTDLYDRIKRIETKLIRGFEEMGVNTDSSPDWLTVDDPSRTIYMSTMGRSLSVILTFARTQGATQVGKPYDIIHRGELVGTLILQD